MFGNTTPAVDRARARLEGGGYEVLVFHATGTGGQTMEWLIADGFFAGSLDLTTTEWADDVCGGVFDAGAERGLAAARAGRAGGARARLPRHGQLRRARDGSGALPGPPPLSVEPECHPDAHRRRGEPANWRSPGRGGERGDRPGRRPAAAGGRIELDSPGQPFWDPEADGACFAAIRANLRPDIPVEELDANINDPAFADRAVDLLLELIDEDATVTG